MSNGMIQATPVQSPFALEALIRNDWDAPLTYDLLLAGSPAGGVFVGREDLLRPLVAAISEADKRGTVLISGYRGSGKTTLVIEALRRSAVQLASSQADRRPQILPVVLNVSEVATSLSDTKASTPPLQIDPKRLLIALLRAFRQHSVHLHGASEAALKRLIDELHSKATAVEFRRSETSNARSSATVSEARKTELQADKLVQGLFAPAGLIAAGLATFNTPSTPTWDAVRGVFILCALVLAGVGLSFSAERTRKRTNDEGRETSIVHDNSLQQLENDLKDLLQELRKAGWRPVIVFEELDKLDAEGQELDLVIRYFKNLFTQAPALFIFITDKIYFDRIEQEIRQKRRERSYAVSHTFFTHRVFVGRPSTRDCLRFIEELLSTEADKQVVRAIYTSARPALESYGASAGGITTGIPVLSLFVRVVLFRACNHLFDLKAELQRFVRSDGSRTVLRFDTEMFPTDEYTLAKFQDIVVEKFETYKYSGGRNYANELLQDFLSGVFHDYGSGRPRSMEELLPDPHSRDAPLDTAERSRIVSAVESLLDDLDRGQALRRTGRVSPTADSGSDASVQGQVEWLPRAADNFTLVRRLERHEEELVTQLVVFRTKAAALAKLVENDSQRSLALSQLDDQLRRQISNASDLNSAISVDAAQILIEDIDKRIRQEFSLLQDKLADEAMTRHGFEFESVPLGPYEPGSGIRILCTRDGDPRMFPQRSAGVVLFVQGVREHMFDTLREFAAKTSPHRVAIVHVMDQAPDSADAAQRLSQKWIEALGAPGDPPERAIQSRVYLQTLFELGPGPDRGLTLGRDLVAGMIWAVRPGHPEEAFRYDSLALENSVAQWLSQKEAGCPRAIETEPGRVHWKPIWQIIWMNHPEIPWVLPGHAGMYFTTTDYDIGILETLEQLVARRMGKPVATGADTPGRECAKRLRELFPPRGSGSGVVVFKEPITSVGSLVRNRLKALWWVGHDLADDPSFEQVGADAHSPTRWGILNLQDSRPGLVQQATRFALEQPDTPAHEEGKSLVPGHETYRERYIGTDHSEKDPFPGAEWH